jgi:hypothetical protein
MKASLRVIACMAALAILMVVQSASAQVKKAVPGKVVAQGMVQGVWKITEFSMSDPSAGTTITTTAQPSIFIFTKKNYSIMYVSSDRPRPDLPLQDPTDAQKLAAWGPFSANSGTYEIKGTTLTTHPVVAKHPAVMKPGAFVTYDFKIQGNTLLLTPKESNTVPGGNPPTFKLVRVE